MPSTWLPAMKALTLLPMTAAPTLLSTEIHMTVIPTSTLTTPPTTPDCNGVSVTTKKEQNEDNDTNDDSNCNHTNNKEENNDEDNEEEQMLQRLQK